MAALTVWTREELRAREKVFQALAAKALRLSARSLETQVAGLLTAAAAPGIEPEPEARSAAFALALGELGTVQATWTARVDAELWPYLTQTFADAAADTAKLALDATGRSGPTPTLSFITRTLEFLRAKLLALGGWLAQKLAAKLRAGYDAGDGARQLAARVKIAAADALPVAANGAADALGWAATLGELTQLQAAGFTDNDVEKEWLTSDDDRVRPAHAEADGQRVGLFQSFNVGDEQLFAPRDPTGRPDNVLGCRCGLGYVFNDTNTDDDDGDELLTAHGGTSHNQQDHAGGTGTGDLSFLDLGDVETMHREMVDGAPWTPEQHDALREYAGSAYVMMNGVLRGTFAEDDLEPDDRQQVREQIKHARAAMRPTTRSLRVGRTVTPEAFGITPQLVYDADYTADLDKLTGKTIREPGFLSTSIAQSYIDSDWGPDRIIMEIDVPAGTPAAYMASTDDPLGMPGIQGERELLLESPSLQIISVRKTPGQPTRVRVRVVNP